MSWERLQSDSCVSCLVSSHYYLYLSYKQSLSVPLTVCVHETSGFFQQNCCFILLLKQNLWPIKVCHWQSLPYPSIFFHFRLSHVFLFLICGMSSPTRSPFQCCFPDTAIISAIFRTKPSQSHLSLSQHTVRHELLLFPATLFVFVILVWIISSDVFQLQEMLLMSSTAFQQLDNRSVSGSQRGAVATFVDNEVSAASIVNCCWRGQIHADVD